MKTLFLAAAAALAIGAGSAQAESGEVFGWDKQPTVNQPQNPTGQKIVNAQSHTALRLTGSFDGNG